MESKRKLRSSQASKLSLFTPKFMTDSTFKSFHVHNNYYFYDEFY